MELTSNEIDKLHVALNVAITKHHNAGLTIETSNNLKVWYEINEKLIEELKIINAVEVLTPAF